MKLRTIKIVGGIAALLSVLVGLGIYLFAEQLGVDTGTRKIVAYCFIAVGIADYLVLHFWDRIFNR